MVLSLMTVVVVGLHLVLVVLGDGEGRGVRGQLGEGTVERHAEGLRKTTTELRQRLPPEIGE